MRQDYSLKIISIGSRGSDPTLPLPSAILSWPYQIAMEKALWTEG